MDVEIPKYKYATQQTKQYSDFNIRIDNHPHRRLAVNHSNQEEILEDLGIMERVVTSGGRPDPINIASSEHSHRSNHSHRSQQTPNAEDYTSDAPPIAFAQNNNIMAQNNAPQRQHNVNNNIEGVSYVNDDRHHFPYGMGAGYESQAIYNTHAYGGYQRRNDQPKLSQHAKQMQRLHAKKDTRAIDACLGEDDQIINLRTNANILSPPPQPPQVQNNHNRNASNDNNANNYYRRPFHNHPHRPRMQIFDDDKKQ